VGSVEVCFAAGGWPTALAGALVEAAPVEVALEDVLALCPGPELAAEPQPPAAHPRATSSTDSWGRFTGAISSGPVSAS
jgi:hypothetical protein